MDQLRSIKVLNYSAIDIAITLVVAYYLTPQFNQYIFEPLLKISLTRNHMMVISLPLSVLIHKLIGQETQLVKDTFDPKSHWVIKVLLLLMVLGVACNAHQMQKH